MSDTNCFYCGEPEETDTPTGITIYRCGTLIYPNGSFVTTLICELGRDLRREREAHNQTKRERNSARAKLVAAIDGRDMANEEADKLRAQNAKLRDIAERLSICAENLEKYTWHCNDQGCDCGRCKLAIEQKELRAELEQLKEGAK
jgi:hypothetical protein